MAGSIIKTPSCTFQKVKNAYTYTKKSYQTVKNLQKVIQTTQSILRTWK